MKILMYTARPDEQPAVDQLLAQHPDLTIDTNQEILTGETVALAKGYDAIIACQHEKLTDPKIYEQLAAMGIHHLPLRITGYDIVDFQEAAKNNIVVTNVPAYSPRSVAEEALAHTMALLRKMKLTNHKMLNQDYAWGGLLATEIHNLTVGVIGVGKIGSTVARIFKALGAKVLGYDIVTRPEMADTLEYTTLADLLEQSDVVTVHTTYDDSTFHLIGAAELEQMKATALLINCARGPIVDIQALMAALDNGTIAGAGLDTYEGDEHVFGNDLRNDETVDVTVIQRLLAMDNVTVTPHIGFYTDAAVKNMVLIAVDDILRIAEGRPSEHIVKGR